MGFRGHFKGSMEDTGYRCGDEEAEWVTKGSHSVPTSYILFIRLFQGVL
jgi:hypothetical protein